MSKTIETVLLTALPASGKSEVRKYLDSLSPKECLENFHIGETVQLDDFPYVHFMRCVDMELEKLRQQGLFFPSLDHPFKDPVDWGTLTALLNEDYKDLISKPPMYPTSPSRYLFWRIDTARSEAGGEELISKLPHGIFERLAEKMEGEASTLLRNKIAGIPETLEGKTVVIEFARGGPDGSSMPLKAPFGYQYSFSRLSEAILERAAILYIWVTPEESRRKNVARTDPDDPGSILHHGVPLDVMMNDYGCDDMDYLISQSDRPDTVRIEAHGKTFYLPVGRFDNRRDKTTFLRDDPAEWDPEKLEVIRKEMKETFRGLLEQYSKLHP